MDQNKDNQNNSRKADTSIELKNLATEFSLQFLSDISFEALFLSEKGICIYQNKTAEEMFGYLLDEAIGKSALDFINPESHVLVMDKLKGNDAAPYECNALRKDGRSFPAEIQAKNIEYKGKRIRITALRDITHRIGFEKNLQFSNERFELALDATSDGIWDWNLLTNEVYFSPHWKEMLGYSDEELTNEFSTWENLTDPADVIKTMELIEKIRTGKQEMFETENRMKHKDGSRIFVLARAQAQFSSKGEAIRIVGTHVNITENKRLIKALEDSENRWKFAVEGNSDGLWDWNLVTNEVFFSPKWIEMLGYGKDEIKGSLEEWDKRVHPDDKESVNKDINDHINGKTKYYKNEHRVLCKGGKYKWILDRGKITEFAEDGKPLRMIGTHSDISERVILSEKSEKNYKLLNEFVKQVPGVLYQYQYFPDGKNCFPFASNHIWDIYEVTPEEVMEDASKVLTRLHPEDAETVMQKITHSYNTLEIWEDEYRVILPSKGIRWVSGIANPEKLKDGSVLWHGYITDITERKETQRILVETERLSAMGEMTGGIAHDFNNALQSIIGNIEIAEIKIGSDNPIKKYLDVIKKAAEDSAERVRSLQKFSGKFGQVGEHHNIKLDDLIDDVIEQSRPIWKSSAEKFGIKYKIEKKIEKNINLYINLSEIRTVCFNIMKNSLEAMPNGGNLKIYSSKKKNKVAIYFEDDGIGMDEATKKRIFQPYFSTKGVDYSRGLGLSNVYSIIKEHGGKISVLKSSPRKGTTIEIELPINLGKKNNEHVTIEKVSDAKPRVLWIDDDKKILEIITEIFEYYEIDGKVKNNAKDVLEEIEKGKYDLVITDIGMPEMNGWELADRINEKTDGKQKVAVVTGWGDQISERLKEEHNVIKIISKPFSIESIKRFIDSIDYHK